MKNITIDEILFNLNEIKIFIKDSNYHNILDFLLKQNCSIFSIYFFKNFNDFAFDELLGFKNKLEDYFNFKNLNLNFFLKSFIIPFLSSNDSFNFVSFKNFVSKMLSLDFNDCRLEQLLKMFLELNVIKDNYIKLVILNDYNNIFLYVNNQASKEKKVNIDDKDNYFQKLNLDNFENSEEINIQNLNEVENIKTNYEILNVENANENYTILNYINDSNFSGLEQKIIILKLRGFNNSEIFNILIEDKFDINKSNLYKFINIFFENKKMNIIENNFIKIFKSKNVDYLTFNKALGLPLESFFYLLNVTNNKNNKADFCKFEEFYDVAIQNNIKFKITRITIDEWFSHMNNISYFFSNNLNLFKLKIENKTLEEIGLNYKITRERVRQKINIILNHLPFLKEMEFLNLIDEYNLTYNVFNLITGLKESSFNFLLLLSRNSKNNKKKEIDLLSSNLNISENIKSLILRNNNMVVLNDGIIHNKTIDFFLHILKVQNEPIRFKDIKNIFLNKYSAYTDKKFGERNICNALTKSNYTLCGPNFTFRYFDVKDKFNIFKLEIMPIISNLNGVYSTNFFFIHNKDLMDEIDIQNKFEFHNFLKKTINLKNVIFGRMPTILFNYKNKEIFLLDILKILSPIKYTDFCNYLSINYGHNKSSLISNISSSLKNYLCNNTLSLEVDSIPNYLLTDLFLKEFRNSKIFSKEELLNIFEINKIDIKYINSFNLSRLNFNLNKDYAMKKGLTIDSEIKKILDEKGFYNNDFFKYSKREGQDYLLNDLINLNVIQLEKEKFISIKLFEEKTKILKSDIINELYIIKKFLYENDLVCLNKIFNNFPNLKIFNGCLSNYSIIKLFSRDKEIKIHWASLKLIFISLKSKNIEITKYIESIIKINICINKIDLIKILENKTGNDINENWLLKRSNDFYECYYCADLQKYFKNKQFYLDEFIKKMRND